MHFLFIYTFFPLSFSFFSSLVLSPHPPPCPESFKSLKHRQMVENYRLEDMSTSSCALGLVHTLAKTHPPTDRQNRQWQRTLHGKGEEEGISEVMIPVIVIITGMISKVAITTIKSRSRKKKRCNAEVFLSFFPLLFSWKKEV